MRWWERTGAVGKIEGNAAQPPTQWNSQSHRSSFAYTYTFYSPLVPKFSPKYPISCACKLQAFNPSVGKSGPQRGRNHTNGVCCWPEKRSWQSNKIPYVSFWKDSRSADQSFLTETFIIITQDYLGVGGSSKPRNFTLDLDSLVVLHTTRFSLSLSPSFCVYMFTHMQILLITNNINNSSNMAEHVF